MGRRVSDEEFSEFVQGAWPGPYRTAYVARPMEGPPWEFGWTAGGGLYRLDKSGLHECAGDTGRCTTTPLPDGTTLGDQVVMGGKTYES